MATPLMQVRHSEMPSGVSLHVAQPGGQGMQPQTPVAISPSSAFLPSTSALHAGVMHTWIYNLYYATSVSLTNGPGQSHTAFVFAASILQSVRQPIGQASQVLSPLSS
jgi:hypothetical protein